MRSPCDSCTHGREHPMDCLLVAAGPHRNLRVVAKVWGAQDDGCADHVAKPAAAVLASARGYLTSALLVLAAAALVALGVLRA